MKNILKKYLKAILNKDVFFAKDFFEKEEYICIKSEKQFGINTFFLNHRKSILRDVMIIGNEQEVSIICNLGNSSDLKIHIFSKYMKQEDFSKIKYLAQAYRGFTSEEFFGRQRSLKIINHFKEFKKAYLSKYKNAFQKNFRLNLAFYGIKTILISEQSSKIRLLKDLKDEKKINLIIENVISRVSFYLNKVFKEYNDYYHSYGQYGEDIHFLKMKDIDYVIPLIIRNKQLFSNFILFGILIKQFKFSEKEMFDFFDKYIEPILKERIIDIFLNQNWIDSKKFVEELKESDFSLFKDI